MNSLYFIFLLGSAYIPFVLRFDKKLQFYKKWRYFFPSVFIIIGLYNLFDIAHTKQVVCEGFQNVILLLFGCVCLLKSPCFLGLIYFYKLIL